MIIIHDERETNQDYTSMEEVSEVMAVVALSLGIGGLVGRGMSKAK